MTSSKLPRTERAIRLFAETLFSDLDGPPPPDRIAWLAQDATALVSATTQRARFCFSSVCLPCCGPRRFCVSRTGAFTIAARRTGRSAGIDGEQSDGAALVLAIKAVLCVLWYEQPENHAAIGGDPFCQPGHRRLPILQGSQDMSAVVEGRSLCGPSAPFALSADVVIVGSGRAVPSSQRSFRSGTKKVIVLEEGPHLLPSQLATMRPSETMRHGWREAGMSFTVPVGDSPAINLMVGRCVGVHR